MMHGERSKGGYDYTCHRTKAVKMRKTPEIVETNFLKADVQGDMAICAGGIMFLLLALGRNGYNAVKAAAAMMLGIGFAPVFFRSLFFVAISVENAPEGITVTATLVDENWDPGKSFRVLFRGKVFVANLLLLGERNSVNHSAIEFPQDHSRETDCQICCG